MSVVIPVEFAKPGCQVIFGLPLSNEKDCCLSLLI